MFNFDFAQKTRSKRRPHPLFSALRYFIRPLYPQHKIYHAFPFHPARALSVNRPRKRLVFDRSLRQLRTERTLGARRPRKKQMPIPKPIKTGPATFKELGQEVQEVVNDLAACKMELSAEDKIFLQQLEFLNCNLGFRKQLQAARELAQRGERDAPKLEKARQAKAAAAARVHEASIAAHRAEMGQSENVSSHQHQPQNCQPPKPQPPGENTCQKAQRRTAGAAKRRVVDIQNRAGRVRRKDLETQVLQAAYAKQVATAAREEAARKIEQERQEALRKQDARAQMLAQNDALCKEREAAARAAEQARHDNLRRHQEARIQAHLQWQEAYYRQQAHLREQEQFWRQEAVRRHQEQLRQQQEQARREQAAREQQARERAAWEKAALDEAHRAAMYRREEALRQAALGQDALSPATVRQEEENFKQRKVFIRQKLLAAMADAVQRGVGFTPYEPEPINAIAVYELKWEELKAKKTRLQHLTLVQLPWPVFEQVTNPEIITYAAVHAFVFDETRPGIKNKTKRDRLRPEILRYHPDKFNSNILPLVHSDHVEVVTATADRVAKFLNQLMELPM